MSQACPQGFKLRAVWRQINDSHPVRQTAVAVTQMKAGLIPDHSVNGVLISRREIVQINAVPLQAHGGNLK